VKKKALSFVLAAITLLTVALAPVHISLAAYIENINKDFSDPYNYNLTGEWKVKDGKLVSGKKGDTAGYFKTLEVSDTGYVLSYVIDFADTDDSQIQVLSLALASGYHMFTRISVGAVGNGYSYYSSIQTRPSNEDWGEYGDGANFKSEGDISEYNRLTVSFVHVQGSPTLEYTVRTDDLVITRVVIEDSATSYLKEGCFDTDITYFSFGVEASHTKWTIEDLSFGSGRDSAEIENKDWKIEGGWYASPAGNILLCGKKGERVEYKHGINSEGNGCDVSYRISFPRDESRNNQVHTLGFNFGDAQIFIRISMKFGEYGARKVQASLQTKSIGVHDWPEAGDGANFKNEKQPCSDNNVTVAIKHIKGSGELTVSVSSHSESFLFETLKEESTDYLPKGCFERPLTNFAFGVEGDNQNWRITDFKNNNATLSLKDGIPESLMTLNSWEYKDGELSSKNADSYDALSIGGISTVGYRISYAVSFEDVLKEQSIYTYYNVGNCNVNVRTKYIIKGGKGFYEITFQIKNKKDKWNDSLYGDQDSGFKRVADIPADPKDTLNIEIMHAVNSGNIRFSASRAEETLMLVDIKDFRLSNVSVGDYSDARISSFHIGADTKGTDIRIKDIYIEDCYFIPDMRIPPLASIPRTDTQN